MPPPPTVMLMPPTDFGDKKSGGLSRGSCNDALSPPCMSESFELKE